MKWSANSTLYVDNFGYSEIGRRHKARKKFPAMKKNDKCKYHFNKITIWQILLVLLCDGNPILTSIKKETFICSWNPIKYKQKQHKILWNKNKYN